MKLLCVTPWYYPAIQFGGPIASVHGLNKALVGSGVDVTVYTTNAGLDGMVSVNHEVNVDGVKVIYFKVTTPPVLSGLLNWLFSIAMTRALRDNVSKFDVVYVNGIWSYPAAISCYYSRRYHKPYVIAPRGMLYGYTMAKKAWKKWPYYKLITSRDMQCASTIHYTTRDEAEQCHMRLGLKNTPLVVPNGVDLSLFKNSSGGEKLASRYPVLINKKVILFLGRICWIKGLDILVKAFSRVAKDRDDVHLLIVGPDEGGYEKKVRGWINNEGVADKTTFTGMLKGDEKADAFAGSDIFALPSYSENFGMVVVEAMACGLPVVISDQVGIYDDVEGANAGIVVGTDAEQLAGALARLLDDPDLRNEMGEHGRALVDEKYGWRQIADSMINNFNEIITDLELTN